MPMSDYSSTRNDYFSCSSVKACDEMGLGEKIPVFGDFANNTGADQPAHPRSLISTFVIHVLLSIISISLPQAKFHFSS